MAGLPSRRTVIGTAWAAPIIAIAAAAPAAAATNHPLKALLVTTELGDGGYDFNLRDGKFNDNGTTANTNVSRTNTIVVAATFTVVNALTDAPVSGASFPIEGGELQDGQGHYSIAILAMSVTADVTQSATKQTVNGTTNGSGQFQVKIATSQWSKNACPVGYTGPL